MRSTVKQISEKCKAFPSENTLEESLMESGERREHVNESRASTKKNAERDKGGKSYTGRYSQNYTRDAVSAKVFSAIDTGEEPTRKRLRIHKQILSTWMNVPRMEPRVGDW